MLKLKIKEKKYYFDVRCDFANITELTAGLDTIIQAFKDNYDLSLKEILKLLVEFKKGTISRRG